MTTENKELTIERTFDASREKVWDAWTDPTQLQQWWGPRGVTNPTCEWEARAGGTIHIVMLAGKELGNFAGQEWPMKGTMQEVVDQEKLVFTSGPIDESGATILETQTTVTFEAIDGKIKMLIHIVVTKTTPQAEGPLSGMEMGWKQQVDKLGEFLA